MGKSTIPAIVMRNLNTFSMIGKTDGKNSVIA